MNEPDYATSETLRLPWMGTVLCRIRARKKGQPAGFSHRGALLPCPANCDTSVPLSAGAQNLENVRGSVALLHSSLTPLTTFYLKFNSKWGPSWQIFGIYSITNGFPSTMVTGLFNDRGYCSLSGQSVVWKIVHRSSLQRERWWRVSEIFLYDEHLMRCTYVPYTKRYIRINPVLFFFFF